MTRRDFAIGTVFASAGVVLPLSKGAALEAQPKRGGTLNILVQPEPPTLVMIAHTAGPSTRVSAKVTEGLLAYDFDLNPLPQLATAWEISPDGLEYAFKLRPGVKWHDGRDFTSADVAFSILALKQVHPRGRATFSSVSEVKTPDALTAVIVLSKPAPYLLGALAASESPIVPKHVYEGTDIPSNPNGRAPIGTGPFKFKEWVAGSHIIYERNAEYWDQPKPYLDRIVVKFIPDAGARALAFETRTVDIGPDTPVPLSEIDRLRKLPFIALEDKGYAYSPTVHRIEFNLDNPYFKHLKVRQAVAHAIDRQAIIEIVLYGYGVPATGPVSPDLKRFYNPNVPIYAYDLKAAERLLDEAGFPRGPDGLRFKLTHDFMPYGDVYTRLADFTRNALAKVGIAVTVRSQDVPTWLKRVYTDRDFDFVNNSMGNMFDPTIGVQRLYWSKNFKKGVPFSNGSGYANPEVDAILESAATERDEAKRIALFNRLQEIIAAELPDINLVTLRALTIFDQKVKDHTVTADGLSGNSADAFIAA